MAVICRISVCQTCSTRSDSRLRPRRPQYGVETDACSSLCCEHNLFDALFKNQMLLGCRNFTMHVSILQPRILAQGISMAANISATSLMDRTSVPAGRGIR